jgi:O-antigen/teichoic acid export membrane protein
VAARLSGARSLLWLAGGLVLVGLSGYVFTALANRSQIAVAVLPATATVAERAAATAAATAAAAPAQDSLTAYYFLVTSVILGAFAGLDQATNRRIAHCLARNSPLRPALLLAARDAIGLTVTTLVVLLIGSPILLKYLLHGNVALFSAVLVGIVMAAAASLLRGVLAGAQRFEAYGAVWATEGIARLALLAFIYLVGQTSVWAYGYVYVVPYAISAVVALAACRGLHRSLTAGSLTAGSASATTEPDPKSAGLLALAIAGILTTAVANLPQLIMTARIHKLDHTHPSMPALGATFGATFLLARMALTALTPYQSMLLPAFTREAAQGNIGGLRHRLRSAMVICAAFGALWALLVLAVGPWVLRTVYAKTPPSTFVFLALGLGTVLFAVASAAQPAIVALGLYRRVPFIWGCGVVATVAATSWPGVSPTQAATLGALAGPLVVLAGMAVCLRTGIFSGDASPGLPEPSKLIRTTVASAASSEDWNRATHGT